MAKESKIDPSCGLCKDIHDWMDSAKKSAFSHAKSLFYSHTKNAPDPYEPFPLPPDADQLGRETWTFLHTMAAFYPQNPTSEQQSRTKEFFYLFPFLYPCNICTEHLKDELQVNPPRVTSNTDLSNWLCEVHNEVNGRLGKPIFDCSKIFERWKLGVRENLLKTQSLGSNAINLNASTISKENYNIFSESRNSSYINTIPSKDSNANIYSN